MAQSPDHDLYALSDSEKLSEVMDEIGVNERLVRKRRRIEELEEEIETVALPLLNDISKVYHFGSQIEGSRTIGLNSDTDTLFVFDTLNVIQRMSERKPDVNNFLMIQNETIPPGYCHLQYVQPDEPSRRYIVKPDKTLSKPSRSHIVKPDETLSEPSRSHIVKPDYTLSKPNSHIIRPDETLSEPSISYIVKRDETLYEPSISYYQKYFVYEHSGQVLLNNSAMTVHAVECSETKQCGPAFSQAETPGFMAADEVLSYYCESSLLQATSWLQELTKCTWPAEDVKQSCRNAGCFVVPVGSKASKRPELEWRVSTCLQERYLMFSLNITQLRCYVLMKMILKTFVKPCIEDVLTSFMCKNVLFYYISASSHDWHKGTLLESLLTCLFMLKECVRQRNCPHFIIPENNLLAGKMTDTERDKLLDIFNSLMKNNNAMFLFDIVIDSLDIRLKMKYNIPLRNLPDISSAAFISMDTSGLLLRGLAITKTVLFKAILCNLSKCNVSLDEYLHVIYKQNILTGMFLPTMSSTLGSIMTCLQIEIQQNTAISQNACSYLVCGLQSDALSGRLKLASVLYCTGDAEGTENVLKASIENYDVSRVQTVCGCYFDGGLHPNLKYKFKKACDDQNELQIKTLVAYCTRFLACEINCIPRELRYELWRVCSDKSRNRKWTGTEGDESCMDLIVVDSLPYVYYLQYKVYRELQSQRDQQRALNNLSKSIDSMSDELRHKETSLNLLGQCLEQEHRQREALGCYISSIKHRPTNNAARLLMCLQLFRILKK